MNFGYRLRRTDPVFLTAAGFGKVAHLPCIFDSRPGYHRLGSQFLIDRGLGLWDPVHRGRVPRGKAPTAVSITDFGHWLCNFLEWADVRGIDPIDCDYSEHIAGRYQTEMLKGIWSRDGEPLQPKTVNCRVDLACEYLTWLADKAHREPFHIPTQVLRVRARNATSSVGHRSREVPSRTGKLRVPKRRLRMPKDAEVRAWLDRVYAKYGEAKGLMAELVLLTAIRREEAACWRTDTLPKDKAEWVVPNLDAPHHEQCVLVAIKYGCKGDNYGTSHGDKIGPEGTIRVPMPLAEKLHSYCLKGRNPALKKWITGASTVSQQRNRATGAVHLFLDPATGERIKGKDFYNAWVGVELPFKGWSVHRGRDWWACSILWREIQKFKHLLGAGQDMPHELLEATALSVIRTQIQPQLRHSDEKTTLSYLQWIADMVGFNLSIEYDQALKYEQVLGEES